MANNRGLGDYPIMAELKDEDKWLKYFTVKQLIYYGIAIGIGVLTTFLLSKIGLEVIGFVLILINLATAIFLQMKIPPDKYLIGSGYEVSRILIRLFKKNFIKKNRVIYTKNYDEAKETEEEWQC